MKLKWLIPLTIMILAMTGCSLSESSVRKFVIAEEQSYTYDEYQDFINSNIDMIDTPIQKEFLNRLVVKPKAKSSDFNLEFMTISDNSGAALFSVSDSWEYKLIEFKFSKKNITNYTIRTLYGVKNDA